MCFHSSNCGVFHDYACDCGAQATVNRKAELEAENAALREQLATAQGHLDDCRAQVKRQAEMLGALQKDAERYRWLRDAGATFYSGVNTPEEKKHHCCMWAMDSAIDNAMKGEK